MSDLEVKQENNLIVSNDVVQLCGFRIENDYYAISVIEVQEVIRKQSLTSIPCAPEFIKGLINLRGQIVTAVSLRNLFGLPESETNEYMNIIVRSKESLYSLMVDEILDVMNVEKSTFEKTPENLDEKIRDYISGVYKLEGKLLITLDLEKILSQEDK
jgi:purine-binding chemotaxis protein CheW